MEIIMENRANSFKWWRELKLYTKRFLINKYYSEYNFFVIESDINKIEEMYNRRKKNI